MRSTNSLELIDVVIRRRTMGFVDYDDLILELNTEGLASRLLKQEIVW
jgi:hypothetical protein